MDYGVLSIPYAVINGIIAFAAFIAAGLTHSSIVAVFAVALQVIVIYVWSRMDERRV